MRWSIFYSAQAQKDAKKIRQANLQRQVEKILKIVTINPYQSPPNYEKLRGDLRGAYSRRITIKHRLVYLIIDEPKIVKIISMWSHYE